MLFQKSWLEKIANLWKITETAILGFSQRKVFFSLISKAGHKKTTLYDNHAEINF